MKLTEADVVWTPAHRTDAPDAGSIRVERHGSGWKRTRGDYWMQAWSAWDFGGHPRAKNPDVQLLSMFILFNTIVLRDGIAAERAHQAFLAIDEYRHTISRDIKGAAA